MALLNSFLLLLLSVCFISIQSYEFVPVLMWETSKSYSPLPALGRINEEFFRDILLDKLNKDKTVLVFLEENLSPEDFTSYDSSGKNLFKFMSNVKHEAQVNYYPFVEAPVKAIESLSGVKVSKLNVTSDLDDVKIVPGQVHIIDLNDAKENEDRSHMLSRHDTLIGSIYKSLVSKNGNVIVLFTARHSSWLVPSELEDDEKRRRARHLLADEEVESNQLLVNTTNVLMYTNSFPALNNCTLLDKIAENENLDNETALNVIVEFQNGKLNFFFTNLSGYWYLNSIDVDACNITDTFQLRDIYAPRRFSYHCNNAVFTSENNTVLTMPGFQVEMFMPNTDNTAFSDAYDCIGFTTAPIWSGLFVTFILALIMTFGLCMIMDIKTMDRFDDPKGKTISINVSE